MKSFKSYLWKYRSIPIIVNSKSHTKYCLKYVGCQPKLERVLLYRHLCCNGICWVGLGLYNDIALKGLQFLAAYM